MAKDCLVAAGISWVAGTKALWVFTVLRNKGAKWEKYSSLLHVC
jgi:hypothetical protein